MRCWWLPVYCPLILQLTPMCAHLYHQGSLLQGRSSAPGCVSPPPPLISNYTSIALPPLPLQELQPQPTTLFPLRPCSIATVSRHHPSSTLRLRALAGPSHFNISLPLHQQLLPALNPGPYVIEDEGGGCTALRFHVTGARHAPLLMLPQLTSLLVLQHCATTAPPPLRPQSATARAFAAVWGRQRLPYTRTTSPTSYRPDCTRARVSACMASLYQLSSLQVGRSRCRVR